MDKLLSHGIVCNNCALVHRCTLLALWDSDLWIVWNLSMKECKLPYATHSNLLSSKNALEPKPTHAHYLS
jgi:hypothetical protein